MKREHGKGLADIASIKEANFCTKKMQTQKNTDLLRFFYADPTLAYLYQKRCSRAAKQAFQLLEARINSNIWPKGASRIKHF
jgi:hypothetical protein